MGNAVFVILHLLKGYGKGFREQIAVISMLKVFPHECTNRIKKLSGDDDIPVLAGISFFTVKGVNIGLIQENNVTGMQGAGLSVEGVGDGTFQNIENFVEPVRVNDLITVFRNFGVKWL
jgi:hypothetical protein